MALPNSRMDCLLVCLATLSILVARIVPLEHSKIPRKGKLHCS